MPYIKFTKQVKGQTKHCMQSKDTGKKYCYGSEAERADAMRLHEAFKHGFKITKKKKQYG